MECKNCNNTIPSDSKFCVHCGEKVNSEETTEEVKPIKMDASKSLEEIRNHLEFIGYEMSEDQKEENRILFTATHVNHPNLIISYFHQFPVITIVSVYTIKTMKSEKNKDDLTRILNDLNNASIITYFSTPDFETIQCASWYPDNYSKKSFSTFLDFFEAEINNKFQNDELKKLCIE
jgi:hypothetical protein